MPAGRRSAAAGAVDRVASAWLIRRFIDPDARFLWLERLGDCSSQALGFDFDSAAFPHVGALVTFEVLVASFGLGHDPIWCGSAPWCTRSTLAKVSCRRRAPLKPC